MSVIDTIRGWFAPKAQAVVDSGKVRRGDGVWESFSGAGAGAPSEAEALAVTAIYACTTLISGAIAALPMHVYRRANDGDLTRDPSHATWWLLNEEFSPRWAAASGWSFLVASKLLHGDAFAEILRGGPGGEIRGLVPIHPQRVRVIATADGSRLVYEIQPDPTITTPAPDVNRVRVLDQDDMIHVPGFGFNGLRGLSALRYSLRSSGRLAITAQDFSKSFLQNSGRPDFVLKTDSNLDDDQFEQLKDRLAEHAGPTNSGRPMILEGGLDLKQLTMPLEEMQLLETRRFQVEEIARAFNVPPFMIGHTEKTSSWGTGVEAMGAGFVRYTLRDHLNAFHNEINRKFFRKPDTVAEFDTFELERGDIKSMFEAVRTGLGRAGEQSLLSVEESRRLLRFPAKMTGTIPAQQTVKE